MIDRVLRLRFQGAGDASPLLACQEKARAARAAVEVGSPEEAAALMNGRHPFQALLTLVEHPGSLSDSAWADAHESLVAAFGRPLAMAVSRGKLRAGG
ncbi:MAG: hypothetical protein U0835_02635 [Isosphaeraceae bacterium]